VHKHQIIAIVATLGLASSVGYGVYNYEGLKDEKLQILAELEESRIRITELLLESRERRGIIQSFQGQISSIGSTVGTLEKLAQTDKELLRKYSKVYFLNENYEPKTLVEIDKKYLYNREDSDLIHAKVSARLNELLNNAQADGTEILIASAFRSFGEQASLKAGYKVIYGSGANQFSADQGYSEHQLGTTIDFTTEKVGGVFSKFEADSAYKWLLDNAYKYGFILSYPQNNTYYKFEPWHWRFVGVKLATRLHDDSKYFYDLDQREIDRYLIDLFD